MAAKGKLRGLIVLLATLAILVPLLSAGGPTLASSGGLLNPGFEDGALGGNPMYWDVKSRADSVFVRDADTSATYPTYVGMGVSAGVTPFKGNYMLRLGTPKATKEKQNVGDNTVSQTFASNGSNIRFAFRLFSWEFRGNDVFQFGLTDATSGASVGTLSSPVTFTNSAGRSFTCVAQPCKFNISANKSGDYLATGWVKVGIVNIPTGNLKLTYTVSGVKDNAHATWAYFDNWNTPPVATVALNSSSPRTNDTLTATATKSDVDNDPLTLTFVWKVNGVVTKTTAGSASLTDTYDLSVAGNGDKGDVIAAEVIPNDGTDSGATVSAQATVVNSPPVAKFAFAPTQPVEGSVVQLKDLSTDPDPGDGIGSWQWQVQGTAMTTVTSRAQNPSFIPPNDGMYSVSLTVSDEDGATTTVASGGTATDGSAVSPLVVSNAPPLVNALNVEVRVGDDLSLVGRFLDTGWLDTHTAVWVVQGIGPLPATDTVLKEEHQAALGNGIVTGVVRAADVARALSTALSNTSLPARLAGNLRVTDSSGDYRDDVIVITVLPNNAASREPNGSLDQAPVVTSDSVYASYVQSAGDIDLYEVKWPGVGLEDPPMPGAASPSDARPLPAGTEVLVNLKGLPADYDLVLLTQSPTGPTPAPFQLSGFGQMGFNSLPYQLSPYQLSPYQLSPYQLSPFQLSPYQLSPFQLSPFQLSPYQLSPFQLSPYQLSPFQLSPYQLSPFQLSPYQLSPFQLSPYQLSPYQLSPLSQMGFTGLDGTQIGGTDIKVAELALGSILTGNVKVVGFSANRGLAGETLLARIDVPGTRLFVAVLGSNGAYSASPYSLQVESSVPMDTAVLGSSAIADPTLFPMCAGSPLVSSPTSGTVVLRHDASPKALFVTQRERLQALYGMDAAAWSAFQAKLEQLAGHDAVHGDIVSLPSNIYDTWDTKPCSVDAANGVSAAVRSTLQTYLASNPGIQYVVVVGSDDVVPYRRVPDETIISNERYYLSGAFLKAGSPLFTSVAGGYNLTDDYYVDKQPSPWQGRELYVPDWPIGRLVETPQEISAAADAFLGSNGILNPRTAFVTGYDFFADGAGVMADNLAARLSTLRAISDSWTAADIRCRLLGQDSAGLTGCSPVSDVDAINAHFTHYAALPASGFTTGNLGDFFSSDEVARASGVPTALFRRIVFSMGCHAGLNVPDRSSEAADPGLRINPAMDFVQAMAEQRAIYVASTGFGLGDDEGIGGTERLLTVFAKALVQGNVAIGDAIVAAKQQYLLGLSAMTVYDEKSSIQVTLYGLPMYRVVTTTAPVSQSDLALDAAATPGTLVVKDGGTNTITSYAINQVTTTSGGYFTATANGETQAQATAGRAIQPRIVLPIAADASRGPVHSVLVTANSYTDIPGFDPVIARPTNEWEVNATEPQTCFTSFWPSEMATVNSLDTAQGLRQVLVVTPGQFRCTSGPAPTVAGTQRLYTGLTIELLRSTSTTDTQPPVVDSVDLRTVDSTTVAVTVNASDPSGIARIIVLRNSNGNVSKTSLDLSPPLPATGRFTVNVPGYSAGDALVVQVVDGAGNVASATGKGANLTVIVVNSADSTVDENTPVTLTATLPDFNRLTAPVSYIWDFGDGTFASGQTTTGTISVVHTYPDDDPTGTPSDKYVTTLKVTDSGGGIGVAVITVTVNDVAPVVAALSATSPIAEGGTSVLSGAFTDVAVRDTHAVMVDWGDGYVGPAALTQGAGSGTFTASHRYLDDNPSGTLSDSYRVIVSVTDDDTKVGTATTTIIVNNVPPVVTALSATSPVNEGSTSVLTGSFADVGVLDTHTALIDWGDGSPVSSGAVVEANGSGTLGGNHVYADNGAYTVKVTVTDDDLGAGSSTLVVTVNNVAPTVIVGPNQTANEGQVVSLAPATFNDLGTRDTHTATIDWGDGTAPDVGAVSESPFGPPGSTSGANGTVSGSHVYADNSTYTVKVTVTDDDGGVGSSTLVVTVNNVAPTVSAGPDQTVNEGRVVSLAPATFNDPGTRDTHTATIDWGDGTAPDVGVVAESPFGPPGSTSGANGTVSGSHVYADNGTYTVKVTVTDDDGGVGSSTLVVTVNNVAPTASAGPDQTANEGQAVSLAPAAFNDPGTRDTHTATIDWGDGTTPDVGATSESPFGPPGSTSGANGTVSGSHVYADNGIYTVKVTVTDDDLGVGSSTLVVTVNNVAPTATLGNSGPVGEGSPATISFTGQSDPSSADTAAGFHYAYACNNGSLAGATYAGSGASASTTCAFNDNGNYTVKGRIIDKDDGFTEYNTTLTVNNVAPVVTAPTGQNANGGASTSFNLGSFTDPGADSPWAVDVDWGDGTPHTVFNATSAGSLGSQSHTYTNIGARTVTVRVTDKDGGSGSATFTVTVPCIDPSGDIAAGVSPDGDLVACGMSNDATTMTIVIQVTGKISDDFQYRVGLDIGTYGVDASGNKVLLSRTPDGVADLKLRYDDGKATGLSSLRASVSGNELTFTFNLADIGRTSGDLILFYVETQQGNAGTAQNVGIADTMPDTWSFGYLLY